MPEGWNIAEIWEHHADRFGDAPALSHGGHHTSWRNFDRRADGLAATLLAAGVEAQDKVAMYLHNGPAYMEATFAAFKAALVPVNTNYRYGATELEYLWDNSDTVAVVFHGTFTEMCATLRDRLPRITTWLWVDDGSGPCPQWAVPFEAAAGSSTTRVVAPWGRSPDDLVILYTGGTTGMPKGVMWRQDDLVGSWDAPSRNPLPAEQSWEALDARVPRPTSPTCPAAPLMHGTGVFNSMWNLCLGGCVVTLTGRTFEPVELLDTTVAERVGSWSIVGDAFAKPILARLDAEPDRWDISSLRVIVSSGVIWSAETKAGLLRHNRRLRMLDTLGSSEAIGMATATTSADTEASTSTFRLGPNTRVVTPEGNDVVPGSGEQGRVAMRGRVPVGYYKDPVKSAETFITIDGERYSMPGDWAMVEADGTVRLLGRGSQCINTGGEKVFPEEVEEAVKLHPAVADAAVVGVPDERFGQAITAVVELGGTTTLTLDELRDHVKARLAAYKAPRHLVVVESVGRAANGKLDYRALTALAEDRTSA